jgi:hypothetical protein
MSPGEVVRTIRRDEVEDLLLRACPSFEASTHRAGYHEHFDDEEEPLDYLLMSGFVRHLAELNGAGRRNQFPAIFALVEDFIMRGDSYVGELATIGFLEDLQNDNLHPATSKPFDFIPYLRPVSLWWWEEIELFWNGKVNPIGSSGRPHPPDMGLSGQHLVGPRR